MRGHPNFQVIRFGRTEAHVARAEGDDAVGQFQGFQDVFGVADHFFQCVVRRFGADDLHHFHFVKLVLADQAAHVFAVRTGFAAEAGGMGGQFQRQFFRRHDAVAHGVGEGNFGGRNQVLRGFAFVAASGNVEQVFAEFRQLPRTVERAVVYDIGRVVFGVAVLLRVGVEHELRQCAVQAGDLAFHDGEAGAGECRAAFKVQAQGCAQINVVFDVEIKCARCADAAHFDVFRFVFAGGYAFMRQVGDGGQPGFEFCLHGLEFGGGLFQTGFDLCHGIHGLFGFFVFALAFEHADFFRFAVALGLQFFGFDLKLFAFVFQGFEAGGVELETACGQACGDCGCVAAELLDV